jgi:hypothetical protein
MAQNQISNSFTEAMARATGGVGQQTSAPQAGQRRGKQDDDWVKAEYWLNLGYPVVTQVTVDGEVVDQERFVSMPKGIPLDNGNDLETGNSDGVFAQLQAARNDLRKDFLALAMELQPGESKMLDGDFMGLKLQIRRAKGEVAPIQSTENPMRRSLALFSKK